MSEAGLPDTMPDKRRSICAGLGAVAEPISDPEEAAEAAGYPPPKRERGTSERRGKGARDGRADGEAPTPQEGLNTPLCLASERRRGRAASEQQGRGLGGVPPGGGRGREPTSGERLSPLNVGGIVFSTDDEPEQA